MTKNEFVEKVENGRDILFDLKGKHMVIFTWLDEGIGIGEQNKTDPLTIFKDAQSLVSEYIFDGVPLGELTEQIKITDYT